MESIRVYCKNTNSYYSCKPGCELIELMNEINYTHNTGKEGEKYEILAAYVDNQLKELSFKIYMAHSIEFLDITHPDGRRTFVRSLSFLLQKAVNDVYDNKYRLILDYSLPAGLYGELHSKDITDAEIAYFKENGTGRPVSNTPEVISVCDSDIEKIKSRMIELIKADLPFIKTKKTLQEAISLFLEHGQIEKARLFKSLGFFFNSVYYLNGYGDTFYGPLLYSTGAIKNFDLVKYNNGFCLSLIHI